MITDSKQNVVFSRFMLCLLTINQEAESQRTNAHAAQDREREHARIVNEKPLNLAKTTSSVLFVIVC